MVTTTPIMCPTTQHVEIAAIRVHGAVARWVGKAGGPFPGGVCSVHVQLAAVFGGLSRTQPQVLQYVIRLVEE